MAKYANLKDYLLSKHERTIRWEIEELLKKCNYSYDYTKHTELGNVIVHSVDYCKSDNKSFDLTIELNVLADVLDTKNGDIIGKISLKIPMHGDLSMDQGVFGVDGKKRFYYGDPYYYDENDYGTLSKRMLNIIDHIKRTEVRKRNDKKNVCMLIEKNMDTFDKAFDFIIKYLSPCNLTNEEIAHFLHWSSKTVQNYRTGVSKPNTIEKVMLICLACKLGPAVSAYLVELAIGGIPTKDIKKRHTNYFFRIRMCLLFIGI